MSTLYIALIAVTVLGFKLAKENDNEDIKRFAKLSESLRTDYKDKAITEDDIFRKSFYSCHKSPSLMWLLFAPFLVPFWLFSHYFKKVNSKKFQDIIQNHNNKVKLK